MADGTSASAEFSLPSDKVNTHCSSTRASGKTSTKKQTRTEKEKQIQECVTKEKDRATNTFDEEDCTSDEEKISRSTKKISRSRSSSDPCSCIFFDDNPKNIAAAKQLGGPDFLYF